MNHSLMLTEEDKQAWAERLADRYGIPMPEAA